MNVKPNSERTVTEVGPGDWIKVTPGKNGLFEQILSNSAFNIKPLPRNWVIRTIEGNTYDMWEIYAYYKAADLAENNNVNEQLFILQRAANEPCHRSDYGWSGTCQNDGGHDGYHKCAACLARDFLGLTPR